MSASVRGQIKRLEVEKKRLAASRDRLRDFLSEIDDLCNIASDAHDNIEYAIERLSEQL